MTDFPIIEQINRVLMELLLKIEDVNALKSIHYELIQKKETVKEDISVTKPVFIKKKYCKKYIIHIYLFNCFPFKKSIFLFNPSYLVRLTGDFLKISLNTSFVNSCHSCRFIPNKSG